MSEKTMPITGGCLYGAVRYEAGKPPYAVGYCHCRMCQQASGNVSGVFASFRGKAFRFTRGEPKFYKSSAWGKRGFCETCGTPLVMYYINSPDPGVLIGSLDHPEDWPPTSFHMGIESQIPWDTIHDDLPRIRTEDEPETAAAMAAAGQQDG